MAKLYLPNEIEGNQVFSIKEYADMSGLTRQAVYFHIERYRRRSDESVSNLRNLEVYIEEREENIYIHHLHVSNREGLCITFRPILGSLVKEIKRNSGQRGRDKKSRSLNKVSLLNLLPFKLAATEIKRREETSY